MCSSGGCWFYAFLDAAKSELENATRALSRLRVIKKNPLSLERLGFPGDELFSKFVI